MMDGVIPEKHQRRVFDMLVQSGLDHVVKEGEVCTSFIITFVAHRVLLNVRDEFLTCMCMYVQCVCEPRYAYANPC